MKKLFCLMIALALCAGALSACSGPSAPADAQPSGAGDFQPVETAVPQGHGEEDQSLLIGDNPTAPPAERIDGAPAGDDDYFSMDALTGDDANADPRLAESSIAQDVPGAIDPSTYQFSALTDTSLGFTFNYPTRWENLPGVFTVCYREVVEPGEFPARVAVTAKKLTHTPEGTVLRDQLATYMRTIYRQYDPSTFQSGTANGEDTFLGREAMSNTYLAYSGETEVKGFIIGTSVGKVVYVFHFCASYEDYQALENIMRYMVRSVQLVDD